MKKKMCRLALRVEGSLWVAYYALTDTMDGAIFLGSIRMKFVKDHPTRREAFIELMREVLSDVLKDVIGVRPEWPDGVQPAPEHERGGNA